MKEILKIVNSGTSLVVVMQREGQKQNTRYINVMNSYSSQQQLEIPVNAPRAGKTKQKPLGTLTWLTVAFR